MTKRKLESPPPLQGHVMIVDDEAANLDYLQNAIQQLNCKMSVFPNGQMALDAAREEPPDLILLDILMEGMNGYQVCEKIRGDDKLAPIPVIFLSGLTEKQSILKGFEAGAVDYITKPFFDAEVLARVKTHLALSKARAEIQNSYEQLQKQESMRDQLVHMIVHDMRSPLQGIFMGAEMIESELRQSGNNALADDVGPLLEAGRNLKDMISTLLDISRMEAGSMPVDLQDCDLRSIIDRALESLGALAREAPLHYAPPAEPVPVHCDAEITRRMVQNLVANAIQHTGNDRRILISIQKVQDAVTLLVRDSGPGIPPEDHQRIFEKFAIATDKGKRKQGGTGLGLSFCKLAAEAQKGEIGVESEIGKGSTFWFTLPAEASNLATTCETLSEKPEQTLDPTSR